MRLPTHQKITYAILLVLGIAELGLLADAYTRFAPFEGDVTVDLGIALRAGIIGAALTVAGSLLLIAVGSLARRIIPWSWHVFFQGVMLVYWITAAVWLQVSFAKLPNRECLAIYGDYICAEGVAVRVLAFILMSLPVIFIPILLLLDTTDLAGWDTPPSILSFTPVQPTLPHQGVHVPQGMPQGTARPAVLEHRPVL